MACYGLTGKGLSFYISLGDEKVCERKMTNSQAFILVILAISSIVCADDSDDVTELQIGVKFKPSICEIKAQVGDKIKVHYDGMLTDGTVFGSTYDIDKPVRFTLGRGRVIKGWDQGLVGMCLGEKRRLKIPPHLGFGERGVRNIPGGATLIVDTELIYVNGRYADDDFDDD